MGNETIMWETLNLEKYISYKSIYMIIKLYSPNYYVGNETKPGITSTLIARLFTQPGRVWEGLLGAAASPDWQETLTHITSVHRNPIDYILLRLIFQTIIYPLWT